MIVLGATAIGVVIVYLVYRHPIASPWKVAGSNVQDISNQSGVQTEVAVAADPSNAKVLFGASNESLEPEIRVYASLNGGRTWTEDAGPAFDPNTCAWGDPSVAIARDGRQYVAFTEKSICVPGTDLTPYLVVGSRKGTTGKWTDFSAAIVGAGLNAERIEIWTDVDGIMTSDPNVCPDALRIERMSFAEAAELAYFGAKVLHPATLLPAMRQNIPVYVLNSRNPDCEGTEIVAQCNGATRVKAITVKRGVAPLPGNQAGTCLVFGRFVMPQQTVKCLGPNPTVTLGRNRVFVTYGVNGADSTQDVAISVFDRALKPVWHGPIGDVKKKADQFWPAASLDASTGKLWACYYDTTGDSARKHAWFVCSSSRDGRHWSKPVRAAETSEDPGVLWEDATIGGFGDATAYGGYPGVAAAGGLVHPLWIDTRDVGGNREEVFASNLR